MLTGKKTYIVAAVMGLGAFARAMGWLDQNQFELLLSLGGSLGLAALRFWSIQDHRITCITRTWQNTSGRWWPFWEFSPA